MSAEAPLYISDINFKDSEFQKNWIITDYEPGSLEYGILNKYGVDGLNFCRDHVGDLESIRDISQLPPRDEIEENYGSGKTD